MAETEPLAAHDTGQRCACVADHNPNPMELHRHHILPLAWGGAAVPDNEVWLCPTSHANVHELLRAYQTHEGVVPWVIRKRFSRYIRTLAADGWALTAQVVTS
jgi:hypothetical protein